MATPHDRAVLQQILNPLTPNSGDIKEIEEDAPITHEGYAEARKLEVEGVRLAEGKKDIDGAIALFTKAIETCPIAPSPYNNRAQALQLLGRVEEALADLHQSVVLSDGKGKSACLALTQRANIYRMQGEAEKAKDDYQKAAELGSPFAKMQLAILNPYAAMCNAALSKVMGDLNKS